MFGPACVVYHEAEEVLHTVYRQLHAVSHLAREPAGRRVNALSREWEAEAALHVALLGTVCHHEHGLRVVRSVLASPLLAMRTMS